MSPENSQPAASADRMNTRKNDMKNYEKAIIPKNENRSKREKGTLSRGAILCILLLCVLLVIGFGVRYVDMDAVLSDLTEVYSVIASLWSKPFDLDAFLQNPPYFQGEPETITHGNTPLFSRKERSNIRTVIYSELDELGRCGSATAYLGPETLPSENRSPIGMIKPSGWQTVRYDDLIEDKYLYNRCHLIGYQLSGENADPRNLITGTRYFNMSGMLPYENMVYEYIAGTKKHVLYRVTPVFLSDNLLASGVLMEAYSLEDNGAGLCFCVYAHNVQPGIVINYATGESFAEKAVEGSPPAARTISDMTVEEIHPEEASRLSAAQNDSESIYYILNKNTKRFHLPSCPSAQETKDKNKESYSGSREELIERGYVPCGRCNP